MAAKTPLTTKSTAGYVNPDHGYYSSAGSTVATTTNNLKSDTANHQVNRKALKHQMFFFTDIDGAGTDTWTSGIKGIVMCAWTPADATDDEMSAVCTTIATGVVSFIGPNANSEGWLHVWSTG